METKRNYLSETPKHIKWERQRGKTIYFVPLVCKQENENDERAYVAMYARQIWRNGNMRFKMEDYLFKVTGCTLEVTLQRFEERLQELQAAEIIQGLFLCPEKVETSCGCLLQEAMYYKLRDERQRLSKH